MKINSKTLAQLEPKFLRAIDANLNRLREGVRVIEDIYRYIYDNKNIAYKLKEIRHKTKIESQVIFLKYRDIKNDVLKESTESEKNRADFEDILIANFKRAQESARALEEYFKLIDKNISNKFKIIRYELYELEKSILSI